MISLHAALAKHVGEDHLLYVKGIDITGGSDEDINGAVVASSSRRNNSGAW
jgi:hypothetical protein